MGGCGMSTESIRKELIDLQIELNDKKEYRKAGIVGMAVTICNRDLTLDKRITGVKQMQEIQGMDGNWDVDGYMLGLYNGLEVAMSILENRDPEFRSLPEEDEAE